MNNKKIIKVALYDSYGSYIMTDGMKEAIKDFKDLEDVNWRTVLAEYLEKNAKVTSITEMEAEHVQADTLYKFAYRRSIKYAINQKQKNGNVMLGQWSIQEIDTSKLWYIDSYDGSEYIKYFKKGNGNQLFVTE